MTTPPRSRSDETRDRLCRAALSLFVEKGITETTTRDIAARAGVAEGTIYRHFSSKEALAHDLFATHFENFARTLEKLQSEKPTIREKIDAMIHGFCVLFDEDRELFSFLLLAQHQEMSKLPEDSLNPVDVVAMVIAEGISRREIAIAELGNALDPELAAAMVLGIVLQTATFCVYGRLTRPMSSMADKMVTASLRILVPAY